MTFREFNDAVKLETSGMTFSDDVDQTIMNIMRGAYRAVVKELKETERLRICKELARKHGNNLKIALEALQEARKVLGVPVHRSPSCRAATILDEAIKRIEGNEVDFIAELKPLPVDPELEKQLPPDDWEE